MTSDGVEFMQNSMTSLMELGFGVGPFVVFEVKTIPTIKGFIIIQFSFPLIEK